MAVLSIKKAQKRIASLQASTKRAREKAGEVMETVVQSVETAGTAFALGVIQGRSGDPEGVKIFGIPMELGLGLGAHTMALLGVGRGMESHLKAVGNGAFAAHLYTLGRGMGVDMRGDALSGSKPTELPEASPKQEARAAYAAEKAQGLGITAAQLADLAA